MNINPIIEKAFENFTVDNQKIPISFMNYTGKSGNYLTYYTWLEQPQNFSDDDYHAELSYGTIDVFSKNNFKNIVKKVKQTLKNSGFTWTDNGPETFEDDTKYYHIPVNFCLENGV